MFDDLISFLSRRGEVDQTIKLTIIRDGKEQLVDLILGPRPASEEVELFLTVEGVRKDSEGGKKK